MLRAYRQGDFIPQWEPVLDRNDAQAVYDCVESTFINEGKLAAQLEEQLATRFNAKRCVMCTSGTIALFMALKAIGVEQGDEVIVPDITFAGTADSALLAGAKAVCVDIVTGDWTINIDKVSSAITPRTKAVIPVHLNGHPVDIEKLKGICVPKGIHILEDCAQSLGSRNPKGELLGTTSEIAAFSLASTKIITCGQGGFVLVNNPEWEDRLIELKDHGRLSRKWNHHPNLGFNFKLTDLQAALALSQLTQLDKRLAHMKELEQLYRDSLCGIDDIHMTTRQELSIPWQFEILLPDPQTREDLVLALREKGIGTRMPYEPLHLQPPFATPGQFDIACDYSQHALWLPSSPKLLEGDVDFIVTAISEFFTNRITI